MLACNRTSECQCREGRRWSLAVQPPIGAERLGGEEDKLKLMRSCGIGTPRCSVMVWGGCSQKTHLDVQPHGGRVSTFAGAGQGRTVKGEAFRARSFKLWRGLRFDSRWPQGTSGAVPYAIVVRSFVRWGEGLSSGRRRGGLLVL